ncbi:MAG: type II toxin-antitoxin system Phd/YefM family antitoxin [Gemmatimonadota bacterium]|nr:type II toxin-antitoxin system Phd/YefM family antitoxin [Gemmatimonadota bacterium]
MTVNIHEAKTHFSKLLRRVAGGEESVIACAGRPIARLVPIERVGGVRPFGEYAGKIRWTGDFDQSLPDSVLREFEDRET